MLGLATLCTALRPAVPTVYSASFWVQFSEPGAPLGHSGTTFVWAVSGGYEQQPGDHRGGVDDPSITQHDHVHDSTSVLDLWSCLGFPGSLPPLDQRAQHGLVGRLREPGSRVHAGVRCWITSTTNSALAFHSARRLRHPVNQMPLLTRETENSEGENAGCDRNPDGCARPPASRFPNLRMSSEAAGARNRWKRRRYSRRSPRVLIGRNLLTRGYNLLTLLKFGSPRGTLLRNGFGESGSQTSRDVANGVT